LVVKPTYKLQPTNYKLTKTMEIKITHEHIELTDAIQKYAEDKFSGLDKYFPNLLLADVWLGKTSNHHRKGDVFECKINLTYPGGMFRAEQVDEDLYKAINEAKEVLIREITKFKETHRP